MITLHRHDARLHVQQEKQGEQERWQTFYPHVPPEPTDLGLGSLANIHELRIPPGGYTAPRPWDMAEVVTYLYQGALSHEDSTGGSGMLQAGEFQRMSTDRSVRHWETNASRTTWAHFFQISLHGGQIGDDHEHVRRRFTTAQRRNKLYVVASADGRRGSLRIHHDALILSSEVEQGYHLVHELAPGRSAWLHIIRGEVTLGSVTLTRGDGAGVTGEPAVSLTAQERTELLLIDVCDPALGRRGPSSN